MNYKGVEIAGSKRFVRQTQLALDLIECKSKRDFNKIQRYLKSINQFKESHMVLEKARFNVSIKSAFPSLEWYASIIIHDTHHYYLHAIKKFLWKPENYREHERLCGREQTRFLIKIKAPKYMIDYTRKAIKLGHWRPSFRKRYGKW